MQTKQKNSCLQEKKYSPKNTKISKNGISKNHVSLDKLAQLSYREKKAHKQGAIELLQNRAKSKHLTTSIVLRLINNNPNSELIKSYWNTFNCSNFINIDKDNVNVRYCKNRFCLVCARVKIATMIHKYYYLVKEFNEPCFVTLTIPNVSADNLQPTIDEMINLFYQFLNKNTNRGKYKGIRKIEVTYNNKTHLFHPHIHFLIDGLEKSKDLLSYWLDKNPTAKKIAQDIRRCDPNSLLEIFKYTTKLIVSDDKLDKNIYTKALDTIFLSLRNKRTIQSFGLSKIPKVIDDYTKLNELFENDKYGLYKWENEVTDWVEVESKNLLTGYKPTEPTKKLINNIK